MKISLDTYEKKTLIVWFCIGIVLTALVVIFFVEPKIESIIRERYSYEIVKDKNKYSTVKGTLEKFYSYSSAGKYEDVMKMLDESYINSNNITIDNIKDYLEPNEYDEPLIFSTRLMCSKNLTNGRYSFLVSGYPETMFSGKRKDYKYYNVILDGNTILFTITPISEKEFGDECSNEEK